MDPSEITGLLERKAGLDKLLDSFEIWLLVFGILVVVGVAGESVFGIRTWWNNRKLHAIQQSIDDLRQAESKSTAQAFERDISLANKEAADANALAKQYESGISEAKARAAEAEKGAAEAKLELAKR